MGRAARDAVAVAAAAQPTMAWSFPKSGVPSPVT